jgi:hypothetical protein
MDGSRTEREARTAVANAEKRMAARAQAGAASTASRPTLDG